MINFLTHFTTFLWENQKPSSYTQYSLQETGVLSGGNRETYKKTAVQEALVIVTGLLLKVILE